MEKYLNLNGNSGVNSFEIFNNKISVRFNRTVKTYTYSYRKAGSLNVENMKVLAKAGRGLNTYINDYVKYLYD